MNFTEDLNTFLIDCGASWTKFGNAGDDLPKAYFPSVTATRRGGSFWEDSNDDKIRDDAIQVLPVDPPTSLPISSLHFRNEFYENYDYKEPWNYSNVKIRLPNE